MSKKKTPPEKKRAAYEKDHYTFAWHSPRGFAKTWKKKKSNANRVLRRKSKTLLHSVQGLSHDELSPEQESFNDNLFLKGLSKKRLRKRGVVNLKEKVTRKINDRKEHVGFNIRGKSREMERCRLFCSGLLKDREYSEEKLVQLRRRLSLPDFQAFLDSEPRWIPKLKQWILSASRRIAWREER